MKSDALITRSHPHILSVAGVVFLLYNSDHIYRVGAVAPAGGSTTALGAWLANGYGHGFQLAPSTSVKLNVMEVDTLPVQIWDSADGAVTKFAYGLRGTVTG